MFGIAEMQIDFRKTNSQKNLTPKSQEWIKAMTENKLLDNIVYPHIDKNDFNECMNNTVSLVQSIIDRNDLHSRSYTERFINILIGEIAEKSVYNWLIDNGKFAQRILKNSNKPDGGYDIILRDIYDRTKYCSVKSSLSVFKQTPEQIINNFQLSSKPSEIQDINIQVYYWLITNGEHRVTVPSENNMAIIGWIGKKQIIQTPERTTYTTENRETVNIKLSDLSPMNELLQFLK